MQACWQRTRKNFCCTSNKLLADTQGTRMMHTHALQGHTNTTHLPTHLAQVVVHAVTPDAGPGALQDGVVVVGVQKLPSTLLRHVLGHVLPHAAHHGVPGAGRDRPLHHLDLRASKPHAGRQASRQVGALSDKAKGQHCYPDCEHAYTATPAQTAAAVTRTACHTSTRTRHPHAPAASTSAAGPPLAW